MINPPRKCATPGCQRDTRRSGSPAIFAYCVACTERIITGHGIVIPNGKGD